MDGPTTRIAQYAHDRWSQPGLTLSVGTFSVWCLGTLEGYLQLPHIKFAVRYGTFNILPSFIWGTQSPQTLIESCSSSSTIRSLQYKTPQPQYQLWIKILCSLRGAIASSVVLSSVISMTTIWQQAQNDYQENIQQGREPPMIDTPTVIRLAGERSNTTLRSLRRPRQAVWPVLESTAALESHFLSSSRTTKPLFWKIQNGEYSKRSSWDRMQITSKWLFQTPTQKILYLEADATSGDESALALFASSSSGLDLDLKEIGQGFCRLVELFNLSHARNSNVTSLRVLLVDGTVQIQSGGGRQMSVRDQVEQLKLADIVIDARALALHAILDWLKTQNSSTVLLETPCKEWFKSIQTELKKHGYTILDRGDAPKSDHKFPMLVYERSSADTKHTCVQYLKQGLVQTGQVCALLTSHDNELDDESTMDGIQTICSSDIYDCAFDWVKEQALQDRPIHEIQQALDSGHAFETIVQKQT